MQATAIGWEIYDRTGSELQLGLVGLIQIIPILLLAIPAGQLADSWPRQRIISGSLTLLTIGSLALWWGSSTQASIEYLYVCVLLNGIAKAFQQPAKASMLPLLVPRECFTNAITWNGTVFQLACVLGPALAGILIAVWGQASLVYFLEASGSFIFLILLQTLQFRPQVIASRSNNWRDIGAGLRFIFREKLLLAAISLDLFAVLLGGAVALLPVYAKTILHVDATGLGWLRTMPAAGALVMSFCLAHAPPLRRAGRSMLWSVVGFGVATIVFGLSRNFWLSLGMLFLIGAFDMISVVVRQTLEQLITPDQMRGRVAAVNGMFVGASNELGGFESGAVATVFREEQNPMQGPTVSVVSGGIGTILVVWLTAVLVPELGKLGRLDELKRRED